MLIVAALALGANPGYLLLDAISGNAAPKQARRSNASSSSNSSSPKKKSIFQILDSKTLERLGQAGEASVGPDIVIQVKHLAFPLLSSALVGLVAFVIYKRSNEGGGNAYATRSLTKMNAPIVVADLESWAARCGIRLPRLQCREGLAEGQTFGAYGGETLVLFGTPEVLEKSWGKGGRAIALHELAHLANGDAGEREKARAAWNAVLIFLLAQGLVLAFFFGWRNARGNAIRTLAMILVIRGIWAGLIRVREYYADWRAAAWGMGSTLDQILSLPESNAAPWERWSWWWRLWNQWEHHGWWSIGSKVCSGAWRKLSSLFRLHPTFESRRQVIANPGLLFEISPDLSFLTGVLLAIVLSGSFRLVLAFIIFARAISHYFFSQFLLVIAKIPTGDGRNALIVLGGLAHFVLVPLIAAAMFLFALSLLVARSIGVQIQRRAIARMLVGKGWGYRGLLGPAFALALGVDFGFLLSPFSLLTIQREEIWPGMPLWLVIFTFLTWLWFANVHGLSRFLLGSFVGKEIPVTRQRVIRWSSAILLTSLFLPAALARLTIRGIVLTDFGSGGDMGLTRAVLYLFVALSLVVLLCAILTYIVWSLLTFTALGLKPFRQHHKCPVCRQESFFWISLGRSCRGCGSELSPWIFLFN